MNQTDDITELFRRVGGHFAQYQEFPPAPCFVAPAQESDRSVQYSVTTNIEAVQHADRRLHLADLFVRLANTAAAVTPRNSVA